MKLSLFTRLLLAQAGLAVALLLVVGGLFYIDRNVTVAVLYAEHWAPDLARAAGLPEAADTPGTVLRHDGEPEAVRRPAPGTPRFAALRRALNERGVPVDDLRVGLNRLEPLIWLHVAPPGRPAVWLGVSAHMLVPEWSGRALLALVLSGVLLVGVSWAFTRRLTRPLERLRARMTSQQLGPSGLADAADGPASTMTPEIAAIDAAYADLLARFERHERERAVLLAGVSHDLRSPLGRIRMAAELLPDSAEAASKKASIVRNVAEADRLIGSFLDYVRSGEAPLDDTVDLAAAARAVVARFERPPALLRLEAPERLPWPRADRLLVERLMANLLDNALRHGRPPVVLRLGGAPGRAWIEVEDAGDGIAPQQIERLQEAFVRGDDSRSSPGTGLGLAIVRRAAQRLGGTVAFTRKGGLQQVRVTLTSPG